jgi:hypothetical protein
LRDNGCLPSFALHSEREMIWTINTRENILDMVQRSPRLSTRRMASRVGLSRMNVWRRLHEENLYPYHDQRVQHLEPGDHALRMNLCHWVNAYPELWNAILFTVEASFTRDAINNLRNVHMWAQRNPHATCVTQFQRKLSLNVWCGILGNRFIGPFVFDNNLTGNAYEAFLRNELPGLLEDIPLMIRSQIYFQHDVAPPHYTIRVRELLNELFPNRWLRRGGPVA